MNNPEEIKEVVKEKYASIALQTVKPKCCCGSKDEELYNIMGDSYSGLKGYVKDADLGLGCGLPTEFAGIKPGDTVVDLGSGAGNDVFIARNESGEKGYVIGIDMTPEMLTKAEQNKAKLGYSNVEFKLGDIENLPLENNIADVVLSNCVLNLVPDKEKAFSEINRILKPGGHFCVSDIVIHGILPEGLRKSAALYAGCISGALQEDEYIDVIKKAGFTNIQVRSTKSIALPEDMLARYVSPGSLKEYQEKNTGIFSITVTATK